MSRTFDVIIVGAGPAGMSAAVVLSENGLQVLVVDEQPAPGGQIWRAVETIAHTATGDILGAEYKSGAELVQRFRACGAKYEPNTQMWKIEPGWTVFIKSNGVAEAVGARQVLLATGAQERPAPFPGWTLPGVLTVGAAQILLKTSRQIPAEPVWVVGSGPLPLLYMAQLIRAGGKVAGWLDTTPPGGWRRALPWASSMVAEFKEVSKGLAWLHEIRRSGARRIKGVKELRALGDGRLEQLQFRLKSGELCTVPASVLLSHEGVIPSIHITQSLGCKHSWSAQQRCLVPDLDEWGETDQPGIFVAGDGAGIGGAKAACVRGELAAIGMAKRAGRMAADAVSKHTDALNRRLQTLLRLRPMLDSMYPPRESIYTPSDETVVCRCEELTAGDIRKACAIAQPGVNQLKAFTRAGMGPCQGRQCGYTIASIVAAEQQKAVEDVGFYRIRPPLKPITLGELASLDVEEK